MSTREAAAPVERIRAAAAACILGVERRTVQALAQRGDLPGAAKVGRVWTFHEETLREWIATKATQWQNDAKPQSTVIGEGIFSGSELPSTAEKSARACEQALTKLQNALRAKLRNGYSGRAGARLSAHGKMP